jgi:hypothetical protein
MDCEYGFDSGVGGVGVLQLTWQRVSPMTLAIAFTCRDMGSLEGNNIGAAGARDLGAALRANTTLSELK